MREEDQRQFHATFFDEAADHVRTLEARLLELEQRPDDLELLNALFRAAHSIKGASGMLGFDVVAALTHAMESVLDAMRSLTLAASPQVASLLLEATDLLSSCLSAAAANGQAPEIAPLVRRLEALSHATSAPSGVQAAAAPERQRRLRVTFRPPREVFLTGLDPLLCVRELLELGQGTVTALLDEVPALAELEPEQCFLGWVVELETSATDARIAEVFLFIDTPRELSIVEQKPAEGEKQAAGPAARTHVAEAASLRVNTAKIDRLINLVGELVIAQAMVSRSLAHFTPDELPRLREATLEMERHTRELQDGVMNIRMVPIGTIFSRFKRLTRDLSESLGKDLLLELSGEDTELDKSMVESLGDPLTHLVRNSADHGLETPEQRRAAGKPEQGVIRLGARHQGGNVVVEVSDDGRGLDTARIRARAVERGLIEASAQLSDDEIHQLIFAPGFSTAAQVTDVSGRGVGMDVVLRSVEALNGKVSIFSDPGRGTRFRLTLPLTLAILDGMSLRIGASTFVVPLSQVVETLPFSQASVHALPGAGEVLQVRGQNLPLLRLSRLLDVQEDGTSNGRPLAVICENAELQYAFTVDELLGKAQFVIKSLETNYRRVDGVLGATILGDGSVSFILDVQALASLGGLHGRARSRAA